MKKRKSGTKKAMMMGIGIFLGGMGWFGTQQAQAAGPSGVNTPVVENLQVVVTEDQMQLQAQCSYQDYDDEKGCIMTLYLYKVGDDDAYIAADQELSYARTGQGSTDPVPAEEGIYQASVGLDYGNIIRQINSQRYYRVIRSEDRFQISEITDPEQEENGNENLEREEEIMERGGCRHVLEAVQVQEATPVKDAVIAYECTLCGEICSYGEVPNSAYASFQREVIQAIENAKEGEVVISTELWVSFHKKVLEAISDRTDVTVRIRYRYRGASYELVIPSGTDVSGMADEKGFCGFRYLEQKLQEAMT